MDGKRIQTQDAYDNLYADADTRAEAFRVACDLRKFELDLYWRRSAYFWAFAAIVFAGYVTLLTADGIPELSRHRYLLLVSTVGFLISWGWFLAIRGGKYWSSSWELHVDYLEMSAVGPLFTTAIDKRCFKWWDPLKAYPHSVGKVNQANGLLILLVWLGLIVHSVCHLRGGGPEVLTQYAWGIPIVGIAYAIFVWVFAATDFASRKPHRQWFMARRFDDE